jgi:hypothetical protein
MALHSWIHMLYPPALRGPAHQAVKRGRDPNDLLSERSPIASFKSFRDRAQPPAGARTAGRFFCGSFFWSLKKMSHKGLTTPLPLLSADFWLDPKTGKKSQGLPKIG